MRPESNVERGLECGSPHREQYGQMADRLETLAAKKDLSDRAQEMVGLISNLLGRKAVTMRFEEFKLQLSVALRALEAEIPNIRVAREALYDVDSKTVILSTVERFLLGSPNGSPIATVNAAMPLCCVLFVGGNFVFYYLSSDPLGWRRYLRTPAIFWRRVVDSWPAS
jgi:hypothetical protein